MRYLTLNILFLSIVSILFMSCGPDDFGACFNASDNNVSPNEVVTFTNCTDFNGGNETCTWSFGDGATTITTGNVSVSHAYSTIGQYEVKLVVGEGANKSTHTLDLSVF